MTTRSDARPAESRPPDPRPWTGARAGIATVAFAAALALAWMAADTLLLIFAGVLFGVFLDGLTRGLGRVLPLPRPLRLSLAGLAVAGGLAGLTAFGGATVAGQARDLGQTIREQSGTVRDWLSQRGIDVSALEAGRSEGASEGKDEKDAGKESSKGGLAGLSSRVMGNAGSILSGAGSVLGPALAVVLQVFGALGNGLVIAFLGAAFAVDPGGYRGGVLALTPPRRRARGARVLDTLGGTLRLWLFGQLLTMLAIFLLTWAGLSLIGVGAPLILGLQAGLLAFVPTLGPLVAGLVILLASLAAGVQAMLAALALYLAIQALESYVLTPLIQQRALSIPPATIFAGQLLLGVTFGLWGLALALPVLAVLKVLVDQLYVEETLGERT